MFKRRIDKIEKNLNVIELSFDALYFYKGLRNLLIKYNVSKNVLNKFDLHFRRYLSQNRDNVLRIRKENMAIGESIINQISSGVLCDNPKKIINLLESVLLYDDVIEKRFDGDIYNRNKKSNKYFENDKTINLTSIPNKYRYHIK